MRTNLPATTHPSSVKGSNPSKPHLLSTTEIRANLQSQFPLSTSNKLTISKDRIKPAEFEIKSRLQFFRHNKGCQHEGVIGDANHFNCKICGLYIPIYVIRTLIYRTEIGTASEKSGKTSTSSTQSLSALKGCKVCPRSMKGTWTGFTWSIGSCLWTGCVKLESWSRWARWRFIIRWRWWTRILRFLRLIYLRLSLGRDCCSWLRYRVCLSVRSLMRKIREGRLQGIFLRLLRISIQKKKWLRWSCRFWSLLIGICLSKPQLTIWTSIWSKEFTSPMIESTAKFKN